MNSSYAFYFGAVPDDNQEDFSEFFQDTNGDLYYYKVLVENDMFFIEDTCGRMIPVDSNFADEFSAVAVGAASIYAAAKQAEELFETRIEEIQRAVAYCTASNP